MCSKCPFGRTPYNDWSLIQETCHRPLNAVYVSFVLVLSGDGRYQETVKSGQEVCASSGVEEDSCSPQSHSRTEDVVCREGAGSAGPGEEIDHR